LDRINPFSSLSAAGATMFPMGAAAGAPLPPVAGQGEDETRHAAEEFAGYLFAQVFGQMRPESSEEGSLFSGESAEMFMNFFDQSIGKSFASSGSGNQLVDQLVQQLVLAQSKAQQE